MFAAIMAAVGVGISLYNVFAGSNSQAKANELSQEASAVQYKTASLETGVKIQQTKADISAYEDYLAAFPNYADLQKYQFESQAKTEFKGLVENYTAVGAAAGSSGRTGESIALFGQEADTKLTDFAGADRTLASGAGGQYDMAKTELTNNLDTTFKQYTTQLDIYKTSLPTLQETQSLYDTAAAKADAGAASAKKAASTWWNPFD